MADYCLSCCSTVDLTPEHMRARDIRYVCFHFSLDGVEYPDDMGVSMSSEELFRRMSAGAETKTSQVGVAGYLAHFESMLREGKDILHVTLSTGLSGTYNSACIARNILAESYPQRKIYIVDSLGASSGYGLMMETLADMRDAGKTLDELYQWIEANKLLRTGSAASRAGCGICCDRASAFRGVISADAEQTINAGNQYHDHCIGEKHGGRLAADLPAGNAAPPGRKGQSTISG